MKKSKRDLWGLEEREAWTPPEDLTVSQCADKYRILGYKSDKKGPWETSYVPPIRAVMDSFAYDCVEEIWCKKPTQSGGTEGLLNMLLYAVLQDPGPAIIVEPNEALADEISQERLDDMIRHCDKLKELQSEIKDESTKKKKSFSSMTIYFGWAGSPASLATRAIRYAYMDEVNKYPIFSGKEASPIALTKERTNTFKTTRKLVYVSTPTTETGYISIGESHCIARFQYMISCPFCGQKQEIKLDQVKFGKDLNPSIVEKVAWYECAKCSEKIYNDQRMILVRQGDYYDLNTGLRLDECMEKVKPKSVGFHFSRLTTPWFSFGEVAAEFLLSKNIPERLMNFRNSWMAEEWIEKIEEKQASLIYNLRTDFREGEVPAQAVVLTAGVDVQKGYLQYVVRAWAKTWESWLIKEGQVETFEDLAVILWSHEYQQKETEKLFKVGLANIDSGYRTDEVYDFVRKHRQARAVKGATHALKAPYSASRIEYFPNGKIIPGGLILWLIDMNYWKDFLARRMNEESNIWHVHKEITQLYAEQVTAEHKITIRNRRTGKITQEWQRKAQGRASESWDDEVYASVAADMIGIRYWVQKPKQARIMPSPKKTGGWLPQKSGWLK